MGNTPKAYTIEQTLKISHREPIPLARESYNSEAVTQSAAELFALHKPHGRKLGKVVLPQSHLSGCQ